MDRSSWPTKLLRAGEPEEPATADTPEARIEMMWQLALDAWAMKGEPVTDERMPRHIVRVIRRGR